MENIKLSLAIITQYYPPENATRFSDMSKYLKNSFNIQIVSAHPTFPFGAFGRNWKLKTITNINNINVTNLWTWQPKSHNPNFISKMAYYLIFSLHSTLWVILNSKKFDVIITTSPPIFVHLSGIFAKYLCNKPWIVDVRDLWIDAAVSLGFIKQYSILDKISRKFEKFYYSKSNRICVTTNLQKEKILQEYETISKDKIAIIPNGVDCKTFYPISQKKKNQIIYLGNVGYAYDLEKLVLSFKYIDKNYNLKLLIVGDGELKEHLVDVVKENNLGDNIIFTGQIRRDQIPNMISESRLGVAPIKDLEKLEYIIPIKVYEYMACSIPFIACGGVEINNIAEKSKAGIVIKNDSLTIAQTIMNLINDQQKIKKMGENGREYVKNNYDRKLIADNLKELIVNIYK